MNIALIAHDAKKELMVQFCIAYCGILSRHNLCATGSTGKMVAEALRVQAPPVGTSSACPLVPRSHKVTSHQAPPVVPAVCRPSPVRTPP